MKNVNVHVPERLTLEQSQKVLAAVLNKVGCPTCYSGYNISFQNLVDPAEINLLVERGSQKVVELGG